jgi:uncharacterized RDD family membrane protein YckC
MTSPAPASIIRRLAAVAYESMLVAALVVALGFALLPLSGIPDPASGHLNRLSPAARAGSFACLFTLCGAYCLWLWTGGRRTLAMKAWRLALLGTGGASPAISQALLRYLAWWIGPILAIGAWMVLKPYAQERWALTLLVFNYIWALFDSDRRFLHDRIAGTRIVQT